MDKEPRQIESNDPIDFSTNCISCGEKTNGSIDLVVSYSGSRERPSDEWIAKLVPILQSALSMKKRAAGEVNLDLPLCRKCNKILRRMPPVCRLFVGLEILFIFLMVLSIYIEISILFQISTAGAVVFAFIIYIFLKFYKGERLPIEVRRTKAGGFRYTVHCSSAYYQSFGDP